MFVDRVQIEVAAGNGGRGMCSFRREKYVPLGGPDGGDGGDGGSVILRAEPGVDSLAALAHRKQWRGAHGESGGACNCHGKNAQDLTLLVPPGTMVVDESTGLVLKDLAAPGDSIVAGATSTSRPPPTGHPGKRVRARRGSRDVCSSNSR